jgi:hypothetical protein
MQSRKLFLVFPLTNFLFIQLPSPETNKKLFSDQSQQSRWQFPAQFTQNMRMLQQSIPQ